MFTQTVYIKKNTRELRGKLRDIGYRLPIEPFHSYKKVYSALINCGLLPKLFYSIYLCADHGLIKLDGDFNRDSINCEENEDMFLAIAALRDDSDFMQWFIWDKDTLISQKGGWILCDLTSMREDMLERGYCHKASVEEIIEHFKDKTKK